MVAYTCEDHGLVNSCVICRLLRIRDELGASLVEANDGKARSDSRRSRNFAYIDYFSEAESTEFSCILCREQNPPAEPGKAGASLPSDLIESFIGPYPFGKVAIKSVFVHKICASWSPDVYLDADQTYQNVPSAIERGSSKKCVSCKKTGATLGCVRANCSRLYHVKCAVDSGCFFLPELKEMYCISHIDFGVQRRLDFDRPKDICSICKTSGSIEPKKCPGCLSFYHLSKCSPKWTTKGSSRWSHRGGVDLCSECVLVYDQGLYCGLCHVPLVYPDRIELLKCMTCNRSVHRECEEKSDFFFEAHDTENERFHCTPCRILQTAEPVQGNRHKSDSGKESSVLEHTTENNDEAPVYTLWCDYTDPQNCLSLKLDMCVICASSCRFGDSLTCASCCETFHTFCLACPVIIPESKRGEWQCTFCKTCRICLKDEDDESLLLCDRCDTAYHIYCLDGNLEQIPDGSWFCDDCVECVNCGARESNGWFCNGKLCSTCHKKREMKVKCSNCPETIDFDCASTSVRCCICHGWQHEECFAKKQPGENAGYLSTLMCHKCRTSDQFSIPAALDGDMDDFQPEPSYALKKTSRSSKDYSGDLRRCALCNLGESENEGRLLFVDTDMWVHSNCAHWSPEVYESPMSYFNCVGAALNRGRLLKCRTCNQTGATISCVLPSCERVYHFQCAQSSGCVFMNDKTIFCQVHKPANIPTQNIVKNFSSQRPLIISKGEKIVKKRKMFPIIGLRIGSFELHQIGRLIDAPSFHTTRAVFPVGYQASRAFLCNIRSESTKVLLHLNIQEDDERPIFSIQSPGPRDLCIRSKDIFECYTKFLLECGKSPSGCKVDALQFFGLSLPEVAIRIEASIKANQYTSYTFRFLQRPTEPKDEENMEEEELKEGSARCQDMGDYILAKRSTGRLSISKSIGSSPGMKGVISAQPAYEATSTHASRYRVMLTQPKAYMVGRSFIHGWGLYANRDITPGEMIIEYTGELIRQRVADLREKEYEARNIGCYMFRLDNKQIVDATEAGNLSRFVNHSCEPNCWSKVIEFEGKKRIVLMARSSIRRGEEITYDYCFELEADNKLACNCGAESCRGFMN